jgi:hypothetical protein
MTPAPKKANPGHNTLDYATRVSAIGMTKHGNRYGRAEPNQSECAHSRRLAVKFAVKSEEYTDQSRRYQPKSNIEYLHDDTLSSIAKSKKQTLPVLSLPRFALRDLLRRRSARQATENSRRQ